MYHSESKNNVKTIMDEKEEVPKITKLMRQTLSTNNDDFKSTSTTSLASSLLNSQTLSCLSHSFGTISLFFRKRKIINPSDASIVYIIRQSSTLSSD